MREQPINKNLPIVPLPCIRVKERTLKDWLAKLDEEVNEFKHELMNCYDLEDELGAHDSEYLDEEVNEFKHELMNCYDLEDELGAHDSEYLHPVDKDHLAEEGADVCVVIHSICQRLGIVYDRRESAQLRVNYSNLQRGRL